MKKIILLLLLCFAFFSSANAFADGSVDHYLQYSEDDDCSTVSPAHGIEQLTLRYPNNVIVYTGISFYDNYHSRIRCKVSAAIYNPDTFDFSSQSPSDIYNYVFTDEQCQSAYGGSGDINGLPSNFSPGGTVSTGACEITDADNALVCSVNPDGTKQCRSEHWFATSTGNDNSIDGSMSLVTFDDDSLFTPTDDPSSCSGGYYSSGGNSYCYNGSPDNSDNIETFDPPGGTDDSDGGSTGGDLGGSTGGDSGSGGTDGGSDTGGSTGGGSTGGGSTGGGSTGGDSGSDDSTGDDGGSDSGGSTGGDSGSGGSTGGDSGTDDGTDDGEGLDGVIDAIGSVRKAINDGFDGLVDKLSQHTDDTIQKFADAAPSQADYDAQFGSKADHETELEEQLNENAGELTQLIDGSGSEFQQWYNTLGGYFGSYFPTLPNQSCTPLVFGAGKPYSFTISCDIFEMIRQALGWILAVFTVWVVLSTMFSARPN
ncbi:hypothetical protein [Salinicola salarius]|uniref:hypothetical protein n=1 Tax=Salinicola salarius TaxID=430457 RepID=UPI00130081C3|nr:hypothetical protein [Salinicola salarius]